MRGRKSGDARELDKLVGAYERATAALAEAEQALKDAESERDSEHERLAADAYLDDSPEAARLNGKAEAHVAEAMTARDAASAAVRGLAKRASELAERVAAAQQEEAEQALVDAVAAERDAEEQLVRCRTEARAAKTALSTAEATLRRPDRLWNPEQERARKADQASAEWLATAAQPWWDAASPEERAAAEKVREQRRVEREREAWWRRAGDATWKRVHKEWPYAHGFLRA